MEEQIVFSQPLWPRRLRISAGSPSRTQFLLKSPRMPRHQLLPISSKDMSWSTQLTSSNYFIPSLERTWRRRLWFSCQAATPSSSTQICSTMLIFQFKIFMANKSNRRERQHTSNSAKPKLASCFVLMWHSVVLISPKSTGLFSMIHPMTLTIISIE